MGRKNMLRCPCCPSLLPPIRAAQPSTLPLQPLLGADVIDDVSTRQQLPAIHHSSAFALTPGCRVTVTFKNVFKKKKHTLTDAGILLAFFFDNATLYKVAISKNTLVVHVAGLP